MIVDPIEGLFSGVSSSFGRMVVGFLAVAAAAAICFLPLTFNPVSCDFYWDSSLLYFWIYALPFMLAGWAESSLGFLIGLVSVITLIASYFTFVQDIFYSPKQSFYATFASATVYYLPVTFSEYRWIATVILFVLATVCYWFPSSVLAFIQSVASKFESSKP